MNEKALKTLEYDKIIEQLTSRASSLLGKRKCENLQPSASLGEIEHLQRQTQDALTRLFQKGTISFGGARDVRGSLKRLEIGSSLGIQELLSICSVLENSSRVKAYGRRENSDIPRDSLDDLFDALEPLGTLSAEIRRCILSEDEISDDASPALRQIRRSIKNTGERIHNQLAGMVNGSARSYLQDAVITMRNGRYCIPVKAEYKNQVPGMIHDQSSTGSTLFIEPMAVVKLNNDIRDLELKEQAEIEAILASLSELAAQNRESIQYDLEYGTAELEMHRDSVKPGQRVVIIDDLIATGGTNEAMIKLIEGLGGKVVKTVFLMELAGLHGRDRLKNYDVESVIRYEGK